MAYYVSDCFVHWSGYSSRCPPFIRVISFKGTAKQEQKNLNNFLLLFIFNSLVQNFLFELRTGTIFINNYYCGVKPVPILCFLYLCILAKIPFCIFTSQNSARFLGGCLCRPLSNRRLIEKLILISIKIFNICL